MEHTKPILSPRTGPSESAASTSPASHAQDGAFAKVLSERIQSTGIELGLVPSVDRPMTATDILAVFDGIASYARSAPRATR